MKQHALSRYRKVGLFITAGIAILLSCGSAAGAIKAQTAPPPEAITACENKSQSDTCSFTAPDGASITGTCRMVREVLACVPGDNPPTATPTTPSPTETPIETPVPAVTNSYTIVDTGQTECYGNNVETTCPQEDQAFYGQDAQHAGAQPGYVDNSDGTVTDLNTGLMWQQTPGDKVTFDEAVAGAETFNLAGYDDWRLPTIKELYSLIDFRGNTGMTVESSVPYIDTDYFDFEYGDESAGERLIDAQYWSSNVYVGTVFGGQTAVFGVNFADGRIKGYGIARASGASMTQFVRYVRGNPDYGINSLVNNGDGTVTDSATGLIWQQADDGATRDWEDALAYCESLSLTSNDDWRLPNTKELQSIVDYTRAPDAADPAMQGPAIDPVFQVSETESWFWSSTTHVENNRGSNAAYVAFGQAYGVYDGTLINVHGAGAQRSDPKSGDPADWADGHGPQNDEIRIYNFARCVRDAETTGGTLPDMPHAAYLPLIVN